MLSGEEQMFSYYNNQLSFVPILCEGRKNHFETRGEGFLQLTTQQTEESIDHS
jgi:hypothetical protein